MSGFLLFSSYIGLSGQPGGLLIPIPTLVAVTEDFQSGGWNTFYIFKRPFCFDNYYKLTVMHIH